MLTPPELELVVILQEKKLNPDNIEDLYACIQDLDNEPKCVERIVRKVKMPVFSLTYFFKSLDQSTLDNMLLYTRK